MAYRRFLVPATGLVLLGLLLASANAQGPAPIFGRSLTASNATSGVPEALARTEAGGALQEVELLDAALARGAVEEAFEMVSRSQAREPLAQVLAAGEPNAAAIRSELLDAHTLALVFWSAAQATHVFALHARGIEHLRFDSSDGTPPRMVWPNAWRALFASHKRCLISGLDSAQCFEVEQTLAPLIVARLPSLAAGVGLARRCPGPRPFAGAAFLDVAAGRETSKVWPSSWAWSGDTAIAARIFEACARAPSVLDIAAPLADNEEGALRFLDRVLGREEIAQLASSQVVLLLIPAAAAGTRMDRLAGAFLGAGASVVVIGTDALGMHSVHENLAAGAPVTLRSQEQLAVYGLGHRAAFTTLVVPRQLSLPAVVAVILTALGLVALALALVVREMRRLHAPR